MKRRFPPWLVLLAVAAGCAGILTGVALLRSYRHSAPNLLSRLPADGAVVLSIDFQALRRAGLLKALAGSPVAQEPEYRAFVAQTAFDYLQDLDSAAIAFHRTGTYLLLQGRFDWRALKSYIVDRGGTCHNMFCKVQGSTEERKISLFPLRSDVMALAVARDEEAVRHMQTRQAGTAAGPPAPQLAWALIPVGALRNAVNLPSGTRMFASALEGADTVLLSVGLAGDRMRVRLDAVCRSPRDAELLASQLRAATLKLRAMIAREHQAPNPQDLSGVLTAGVFEHKDVHVYGEWPLDRSFLASLAGGSL